MAECWPMETVCSMRLVLVLLRRRVRPMTRVKDIGHRQVIGQDGTGG